MSVNLQRLFISFGLCHCLLYVILILGIPGRVVIKEGKKVDEVDLNHQIMPDPVAQAFNCMMDQLHLMNKRVNDLAVRHDQDEEHDQAQFETLRCRLEGIVKKTIEDAAREYDAAEKKGS